MVPELAVVFLVAAAIILVPLFVAGDLWARARNRSRLPSPPALATIAFGMAASLSNGLFAFRVLALDGDGVTGLSIVTALWTTMALTAIWVALRTQRVRLYAARATDRVLPAPPMPAAPDRSLSLRATTAPATPAPDAGAPGLVVYRDDPTPDRPCATPLYATRLPPTIRDIVRAEARQANAPPVAATAVASATAERPGAQDLPPDALVLQVTRRARFPVRGMAETGRSTRTTGTVEPAFRSTRRWDLAPTV